ncbi:MAG: NADH-quinone oxidoreductase subunit A [Deltaproteobacteria bacterium]|nr:NADH-quinone oxidoreductase subunit A [Deltaproteobacteria bacterium]
MNAFLLKDYFFVLLFLLVGIGFGAVPLILAALIAPRTVGRDTLKTYESGMIPFGTAWVQFGVAYYLFALIFLAFDVDVLYLFPVLLAYGKEFVIRDFIELLIFLGILALAIVYAWRKGVFGWK